MIVLLVRPLVCYLLSVVTNELRLKIHTGTFLCCYQWKQSSLLACTLRRAHANNSPFPAAYSDLILTQMIDSARIAECQTLQQNTHICLILDFMKTMWMLPDACVNSPHAHKSCTFIPDTCHQTAFQSFTSTLKPLVSFLAAQEHEPTVTKLKLTLWLRGGYCIWDDVGDREMKTHACGGGNREAVVAVNIRGQTGTSWTKEKSG